MTLVVMVVVWSFFSQILDLLKEVEISASSKYSG